MATLVSHPDEVRIVSKRFGQGAADLDRYLVNLFEGWLPPTTPKPVKATRTSPIEEPVVEAPKAAKKPRGAMF